MVTAPASTGITATNRKAVINQVQENMGNFIRVIPGARRLSAVTMILIAPMMDDAPAMCTAKINRSMPGPIWVESGAYIVQPAAAAPPGAKNDQSNKTLDIGSNQKLRLFIRAKAMS